MATLRKEGLPCLAILKEHGKQDQIMTFNYKYRITYGNGRTYDHENILMCVEITEEEYKRILRGIKDGYTLNDAPGIEDVRERMREDIITYDPWRKLDGAIREQKLTTPREIREIDLYLEEREVRRIRAIADIDGDVERPEQKMTIYRTDGSYVELVYKMGKVQVADSKKSGYMVLGADQFASWVTR